MKELSRAFPPAIENWINPTNIAPGFLTSTDVIFLIGIFLFLSAARILPFFGKSVGKWVYRNMSAEGFRKWADQRRKKSISVRQAAAAIRAKNIQEYKKNNSGVSNRAIAKLLSCSLDTVNRALK